MVAVIKTGHSLRRILNYNENKVSQGVAVCIGEKNYPMDPAQMNFAIKLGRLQNLSELNANVTRNSVHISLNFDPSEKDLGREKLNSIAREYMDRIGFGQQPFLVYEHRDAGHPHLHIVSVKIRADGSRIDMQNIGKNQSEVARHEMEKKYGLVPAQSLKKGAVDKGFTVAAKVVYGKTDSRRAVTNVLNTILPTYRYASLYELNAVLRQYNVMADRGSEKSRMYNKGGLVYRILDESGNKVGVPLKASSIYSKPTLGYLEKRFKANGITKGPFKNRIKNTIDQTFLAVKDLSLHSFCKLLEKEGINAMLRQNEQGLLYGITYIDHRTKCVFNGSALGKAYSAKGILERCAADNNQNTRPMITRISTEDFAMGQMDGQGNQSTIEKTIEHLLRPENTSDYLPNPLKKRKKRKGRSGN